jgi:hypothetical protein
MSAPGRRLGAHFLPCHPPLVSSGPDLVQHRLEPRQLLRPLKRGRVPRKGQVPLELEAAPLAYGAKVSSELRRRQRPKLAFA